MFRTLIRVDMLDEQQRIVFVIIPGWSPIVRVRLPFDTLPPKILKHMLKRTKAIRYHAEVNLDAHIDTELRFANWEVG